MALMEYKLHYREIYFKLQALLHMSLRTFSLRITPRLHHIAIALILLSLILLLPSSLVRADEKEVVGWVEKVRMYPSQMLIQSKLDTGADYSSINASDIQQFDKNGENWVKFTLRNRYGDSKEMSEKVLRMALIKRHGGKAPQKRPVIQLAICLGDHYMETAISLVDRSNFDYQLLVGRDFLAGNFLIDPSSTYLTEPSCKKK